MTKQQQRIERICDVEREYFAVKSALRLLGEQIRNNPAWGDLEGWGTRDVVNSMDRLEATYIIRLFAEFESGVREVWKFYYKKTRKPRMVSLLTSLATQRISKDQVDGVDEVRVLRNFLVHDEINTLPVTISLEEAKSRLCRYFSQMPRDW